MPVFIFTLVILWLHLFCIKIFDGLMANFSKIIYKDNNFPNVFSLLGWTSKICWQFYQLVSPKCWITWEMMLLKRGDPFILWPIYPQAILLQKGSVKQITIKINLICQTNIKYYFKWKNDAHQKFYVGRIGA